MTVDKITEEKMTLYKMIAETTKWLYTKWMWKIFSLVGWFDIEWLEKNTVNRMIFAKWLDYKMTVENFILRKMNWYKMTLWKMITDISEWLLAKCLGNKWE